MLAQCSVALWPCVTWIPRSISWALRSSFARSRLLVAASRWPMARPCEQKSVNGASCVAGAPEGRQPCVVGTACRAAFRQRRRQECEASRRGRFLRQQSSRNRAIRAVRQWLESPAVGSCPRTQWGGVLCPCGEFTAGGGRIKRGLHCWFTGDNLSTHKRSLYAGG
jgi:hypothetical protein